MTLRSQLVSFSPYRLFFLVHLALSTASSSDGKWAIGHMLLQIVLAEAVDESSVYLCRLRNIRLRNRTNLLIDSMENWHLCREQVANLMEQNNHLSLLEFSLYSYY